MATAKKPFWFGYNWAFDTSDFSIFNERWPQEPALQMLAEIGNIWHVCKYAQHGA